VPFRQADSKTGSVEPEPHATIGNLFYRQTLGGEDEEVSDGSGICLRNRGARVG